MPTDWKSLAQAAIDIEAVSDGEIHRLEEESKNLRILLMAIINQNGGTLCVHAKDIYCVRPFDRLESTKDEANACYTLRVIRDA